MKNTIEITAHASGFWVIHETDSDSGIILADHRRYADALAAAHLFARQMGLSVETQPQVAQ